MSRRTGQNGSVSVRNGAYRGRWLEDVPGSVERVKRSVVLGFVREMTRSEARRKLRGIIEASGINSPRYLIPSADSFAKRVEWWKQVLPYVASERLPRRRFLAHEEVLLPPLDALGEAVCRGD